MDETFKESFSPDNDMLNALIESVHRDISNDYTAEDRNDPEHMEEALKKARSRKSRNKWIPTILCVLLVLGLAGTAVWFFFLKPELITIDSFEVIDQTVDSLTVSIETQEEPGKFQVVCTDAYGFEARQDYTGQPNTFTGLASGSQYTIALEGVKNVTFEGAYSLTRSTKSTTNVISFTVTRETVNEMELSFIVDGEEPEEWTVSYGPQGQEAKTKVFTGHSIVLTGLEPDTVYDVTLTDPMEIHLTGTTTVSGKTLPSVSMGELNAVLSSSMATLTWTYEGPAPESWNVTTTGTDGYTDTQTVSDSTVVLEGLKAGETYSILITCDNMELAATTSFTPNALRVMELKAEVNETGGIDVTWETEAQDDEVQWLVVYGIKGSNSTSSAEQTGETAVTLTDTIPNSTYIIEIQEATGKQVGGDTTTVEITMPAPEAFKEYGFTRGYASTWLRPTQEEWTINNLANRRNSFKATDTIAFACESLAALDDSDEKVQILLVVRNAEGGVVDHYNGEEIWDEMWTRNNYVGELLRTPQEVGEYTLEIYFNGKQVDTGEPIAFKITE